MDNFSGIGNSDFKRFIHEMHEVAEPNQDVLLHSDSQKPRSAIISADGSVEDMVLVVGNQDQSLGPAREPVRGNGPKHGADDKMRADELRPVDVRDHTLHPILLRGVRAIPRDHVHRESGTQFLKSHSVQSPIKSFQTSDRNRTKHPIKSMSNIRVMSLIIRQALWSNPWGRFFRFGEKYNAVSFTSNPVFLTCIALSYNRTE